MKTGGIPAQLTVVLRPEVPYDLVGGGSVPVRPAFYADADKPWCVKLGREWGQYDDIRSRDLGKPELLDRPNEPFTDLRLVGLDIRTEGGRAYKVLTTDNHLVDLREDVVLDILLTTGVRPSGHIAGEFLWAMNGSQMRIVRVGSTLHTELAESQERKALKVIKVSALTVGGVYRTRSGDFAAFLGFVRIVGQKKKLQVWHGLWGISDDHQEAYDKSGRGWSPTVKGSHSYVEKVGTIVVGDRSKVEHFSMHDYDNVPACDFTWL